MNQAQKKHAKLMIFLVVFVDLVGFGVMIPMLPFFARHFGATPVQIGALMFAYSFMQMLLSPFWGQLSDRFGRRPILLLTMLGQATAFLWAGFSPGYTSLLLSRFFAGAFSANISTANAYIADITSKEERAKGMGMIGAAFGLGFIFGPAIGGFLIGYGYEWPSFFAAGLSIINFSWSFFALQEPVHALEARQKNRRRLNFDIYKQTLSQSKFLGPIIVFFLLTLAFVQMEITFGIYVQDRFGLSERNVGYVFAIVGLMMAIIQGGLIGRLVKKYGEVRLITIALPLICLGFLGMIFSWSLPSFLVADLILAIGYSLNSPCISALISKAAPDEKQGSVLGVYQSAGSLARVVGPNLAGFLYSEVAYGAFLGGLVASLSAKIAFWLYLIFAKKQSRASL